MNTFETGLKSLGIEYSNAAEVRTSLLTCRAELLICPTPDQVQDLFAMLADEESSFHIHGGGTNTLLLGSEHKNVKTPIIDTRRMRRVYANPTLGTVVAESGAKMTEVSRSAAKADLSGLEFARDIPGTVAGAVVTDAWHPIHMYAPLFAEFGIDFESLPKHVSSVLQSVEVIDETGSIKTLSVEELEMHDRQSVFSTNNTGLFILSTKFQLAPGDPMEIALARDVICDGRKQMRQRNKAKNQFSVGKTLGYTFVLNHPNYAGLSAAQIIEKTERLPEKIQIDGMMHSKLTPNIVGNTGHGSSSGYLRVAETIQEAVFKEHNIEMPLEVRLVA